MHKEEASKLFLCLGDGIRVKIVKMLYHNDKLALEQLCDCMDLTKFDLEKHLNILCDSKLIIKAESNYKCNKDLVDTLMTFITTKCGCCSR